MLRFIRTLLVLGLLLLFGLAPALLRAQERKSDSPVFRSYRPPPVAPRVQESDALRQIWSAFLAARKAQAGDRHAQEEMGIRYLLGQGVERDTAKAAYWMLKAAGQGMVRARFNVAIMAFHGWGMPWDPFVSYRYLLESAREGMPEAEYFIALVLTEDLVVPRDWKQAYAWMKKAAEAGYQPAKEVLAEFAEKSAEAERPADVVSEFAAASSSLPPSVMPVMVDFTADTAQSRDRSLGDILKGAGGNLRVALGLADSPDSTLDTPDSTLNVDSVAFRQLLRAADAGSPEALTMLGRCAERGLEMKKDSVAAAAYFVRGTRLDGPKAPQLLAQLFQQGSFQAQLKTRSSRSDPIADFVWAGAAALGFDNLIAPSQALHLLRRSVDRGFVPALVEMGIWHYSGKWVVQDVTEADSLWHRAARAGSRDAEVRLAVTALRETGSEAPDSAAVALLRKAIPEGSLLAQVGLGYCHEHGIGVRKDAGEAAIMYRAAAVRGSQDAFRALRRLYDSMRPSEKEFVIEED